MFSVNPCSHLSFKLLHWVLLLGQKKKNLTLSWFLFLWPAFSLVAFGFFFLSLFLNLTIKNLVTGPVIKSKILSLIPGSDLPEGEKQRQQVDLWPPHMCHPATTTYTQTILKTLSTFFFLYFMCVLVSELLKFEVLRIFSLINNFQYFLPCSAFFILLSLPGLLSYRAQHFCCFSSYL